MAWNFADEGEQTESRKYGPVPSGSCVFVEIEPQETMNPVPGIDDSCVSKASTGLLQVYFKFTVTNGEYKGVKFFQSISLPESMQRISLNDGQIISCRIGGAQIKAMCEAMNKPASIRTFSDMTGWKVPVRVRIKDRPKKRNDGGVFWNNEIDRVLTKKDAEWAEIRRPPYEIINPDGAVTGTGTIDDGYGRPEDNPFNGSESHDAGYPFPTDARQIDEPPF